ncbi:MAG: DNA-directed DNA polymerase [Nitrospinaceae bacterium]|nr:MAG: DNA-directed DNA polymerase [Nitrospinaceae bacterium]
MHVHLNCHSNYSLLAGANGIDDLVQAASRMGFSALALTDTHGLYGAVQFYRSAREAGIRPIFGAEINETGNPAAPEGLNGRRAVLLAKNRTGLGEICRVVSDRHLQENFSLTDCLKQLTGHVIVLCPNEEILKATLQERGDRNIYAELTRAGESWSRSTRLMSFARAQGLPCAATNRAFFVREQDWPVHRLLSAIRTNSTIHSLAREAVVDPEAWLKPESEMLRLFSDCPEAIRNTRLIAEQCDVSLSIGELKMPPFEDFPVGENHSSYLRKLAWAGIQKHYHPVTSAVEERVRYELDVIDHLNFASYFLLVWDVVREAGTRGIPMVCRGSAANSVVCKALDITEVDPIRYNLYFERFLNPKRVDFPDIDIDFPWNRRDEMLDYVFQKYGHENVALISTHIHLRGRSALREVGKALGVSVPEIDAFTSQLPFSAGLSQLEKARAEVPECCGLPLEDEPYRSMIAWGKKIEGFPRHLSIHCGGIVVSPEPITNFIPLQKTPKGFVVTQYDMYPVEDMGLLKIDLLAQKGLAVEADAVRAVKMHYGKALDFSRIDPTQDEKTKALIKNGDSMGCFYIESPGMRNLLQKLEVDSFEMLTAASSIIRPGVSESGMMRAFIDRHNGKEAVQYLHPMMEPILRETYGVMIYQEDVIKVANAIAGMSLSEAEGLRKCMSKKRDWESMENYKARFLSGALKNGVCKTVSEEIWREMESFGGYAFCKGHSASFALVSYRAAFLKAHYPSEFMAAVLSNRGGFYDAGAYLEEARRMGLEILLPHVNHSRYEFSAEFAREEPGNRKKFIGQDRRNAIRAGLMQVRNLSRASISAILKNREQGPYRSLRDFLARVEMDDSEVETLIYCGAFDGMRSARLELMWEFLQLRTARRKSIKEGTTLFPEHDLDACTNVLPWCEKDYTLHEKLRAELECLDLTVSDHILRLYDADCRKPIIAKDLRRYSGKFVTLVGWVVAYKRTRTAKNELMKFLTLEDRTATFEVTVFPGVYRRVGHILKNRGPFIVKGFVEQEGRCYSVTAHWLGVLSARTETGNRA